MLGDIDVMISDRLSEAVEAPVWHEERPQETGATYVTYATSLLEQGEGSARLRDLLVDVQCRAPTLLAAGTLAEAVHGALGGMSRALNGARVLDLQFVATDKTAPQPESPLWTVVVRFRGKAIE